MSFDFHGPEEVVTTFLVNLDPRGDHLGGIEDPSDLALVKGCANRYAIEHSDTIRVCTLGYYREDGPSLVWDLQEGVVTADPQVEQRQNDPVDVQEQERIDAELVCRDPLRRAIGEMTTERLTVHQTVQTSLTYGDNCLIWCSSIKHRDDREWSAWRASLESSYDHVTTIYDPHLFARALGSMAFRQKGLLGNPLMLRNPHTGQVARCRNLPVVYGPVVYKEDRRAFIEGSPSLVEFLVRGIFTKTMEHRHQREVRLAILSDRTLAEDTLHLNISSEMRKSLQPLQDPHHAGSRKQSPIMGGCMPSLAIRRTFSGGPTSKPGTHPVEITLASELRASLPLTGTRDVRTTTTRLVVRDVKRTDDELIEQAIKAGSTSPSDARIAKFVFDAGPRNIFRIYDLDGLSGTYRLVEDSGRIHLKGSLPQPKSGEEIVRLHDLKDFAGTLHQEPGPIQLKLSATFMNPAAHRNIDSHITTPDLPCHCTSLPAVGAHILVTATSEDGTTTSTFEIVIDRNLGVRF